MVKNTGGLGTPLAAEVGAVLMGTLDFNLRSVTLLPEPNCIVGTGGMRNSPGVGVGGGGGVGMRVGTGLRVQSLG